MDVLRVNTGGTLRAEQCRHPIGELLVEQFAIFARFRVCLQLGLWLVCSMFTAIAGAGLRERSGEGAAARRYEQRGLSSLPESYLKLPSLGYQ